MRICYALLIILLVNVCVTAEDQWIGIGLPASPDFQLLESNRSRIVFDVHSTGVWTCLTDSGIACIAGESSSKPVHDPSSSPSITALIAIPANCEVMASMEVMDARPMQLEPNTRVVNLAVDQMRVGNPNVMRGLTVIPVTVPLTQLDGERWQQITHARVRLDMVGGGDWIPRSACITEAFYQLWNQVVLNSREILDPVVPIPGAYLIIAPDNITTQLSPLVQWKRRSGHPVKVATLSETGPTADNIKNYIVNAYNTWDIPPEFVILVGDVSGSYNIPTFYIAGTLNPWDCTDLPFTLVEGDDYFPEMLIGRLSVSTLTELTVIVNKILSYEKSPSLIGNNWFERSLMIAVDYSYPLYQTITSPRLTKLWCRDLMLDYGFDNVDTVFYPAQPSAQLISNSINNGLSLVNYRGFGSPGGWSGPDYLINNIYNDLNNIHQLPVVTSIVCGGGNFAYDFGPCFGEAWIRVGTAASPRGAVAFIGPSEGDTKTWFNNCIDAGIYWGIFHDELPTLGQVLLRGKLEAYIQFPLYHAAGTSHNSVHFYYHVYNILGDPGLRLWTARPTSLTVNHPTALSAGSNNISVAVTSSGSPMEGARVALATPDTMLAVDRTNDQGLATLVFSPISGDSVWFTVTARNRLPYLVTISITHPNMYIALDSYTVNDDDIPPSQGNGDGIPNPGERLEITVTGRNTGTLSAPNVTAILHGAGVIDSMAAFGTIPPGGTSIGSVPFVLDVPLQARDGEHVADTIAFRASAYEWQSILNLAIEAPIPQFVSYRALDGGNGLLDPGEQSNVTMSFTNLGSAPTGSANLTLSSQASVLQLIDSVAVISSIDPGDTLEISGNIFTMRAQENILPAEPALLPFQWEAANGWEDSGEITIALGEVGPGDPTAPDFYGYRAYDEGDSTYPLAPLYHWVELNPAFGGLGEDTGLRDSVEGSDRSMVVDLPFIFLFYGESYERITICTNGWICMGQTSMITMNNYGIPSPMSPPALVAGFWDDLKMPTGSHIFTHDDQLNHRFVIEYYSMANVADGSEETFQIILHDPLSYPTPTGDGIIKFQYQVVHDVDEIYGYATVGIQCPEPRGGLQYSYFNSLSPGADSLRAGRAIQFVAGGNISGPFVRANQFRIDDDNLGGSSGNNNGEVNNAETIELYARMRNYGTEPASGLTATLRSEDTYVTILDSMSSYGSLSPQDTLWNSIPFRFAIRGDTPHDHRIALTFDIRDNQTHQWISSFGFYVHSPLLYISSAQFDDDAFGQSQGNDNGEINPGETVELAMTLGNQGGNQAAGVQAILRTIDPLVALVDSVDQVNTIPAGDSLSTGFDFAVAISEFAQDSDLVALTLYLEDATGAYFSLPFTLLIKDFLVLYHHKSLSDPSPGNNNNYADPGETVEVTITLHNPDQGTATGISATVICSDPYYSLTASTITFPNLPGNSQVTANNTFSITVADSCPNPYRGLFYLNITADGGYAAIDSFHLTAGRFEIFSDFDGDFPAWNHGGIEDSWDTTGIDYQSFHKSLYCGDENTLHYPNSSAGMAFSPQFDLNADETLVFDNKYDFSDTDYGRIMIATNSGTVELARYNGSSGGWRREEISLSSLTPTAGTRLIYGVVTNASGTDQGWWLDNVMVLYDYIASVSLEPGNVIPKVYYLDSAYPNPFNASTVIPYGVPEPSLVLLEVYNILGQRVTVLENAHKVAGNYKALWNAIHQGSGIYFIRMEAGDFNRVNKIVLIK